LSWNRTNLLIAAAAARVGATAEALSSRHTDQLMRLRGRRAERGDQQDALAVPHAGGADAGEQ
jgi:hypothetical protein